MTDVSWIAWFAQLLASLIVILFNIQALRLLRIRRKSRRSAKPVNACHLHRIRPPGPDLITLCLTSCDLFRGLAGLLVAIAAILEVPAIGVGLLSGNDRFCSLTAIVASWSGLSACLCMPLFVLDRLIFLIDPIKYSNRIPVSLKLTAIVYIVGVHGFVVSFIPVVGWGSYAFDQATFSCDARQTGYAVFRLVYGIGTPTLLCFVLFVKLKLVARRKNFRILPYIGNTLEPTGSDNTLKVDAYSFSAFNKRLIGLIGFDDLGSGSFLFGAYVLSWVSFVCLESEFITGSLIGTTPGIMVIVAVTRSITLVTSLTNPLVTLHENGYKTRCSNYCGYCCCRRNGGGDPGGAGPNQAGFIFSLTKINNNRTG